MELFWTRMARTNTDFLFLSVREASVFKEFDHGIKWAMPTCLRLYNCFCKRERVAMPNVSTKPALAQVGDWPRRSKEWQ